MAQIHYCYHYILSPTNQYFAMTLTNHYLWVVVCGGQTLSKNSRVEAAQNSGNFQEKIDLYKPILKQVVVCKGQWCKFITVTTTFYPLQTNTLH